MLEQTPFLAKPYCPDTLTTALRAL